MSWEKYRAILERHPLLSPRIMSPQAKAVSHA
jgi:hypothetical protein